MVRPLLMAGDQEMEIKIDTESYITDYLKSISFRTMEALFYNASVCR